MAKLGFAFLSLLFWAALVPFVNGQAVAAASEGTKVTNEDIEAFVHKLYDDYLKGDVASLESALAPNIQATILFTSSDVGVPSLVRNLNGRQEIIDLMKFMAAVAPHPKIEELHIKADSPNVQATGSFSVAGMETPMKFNEIYSIIRDKKGNLQVSDGMSVLHTNDVKSVENLSMLLDVAKTPEHADQPTTDALEGFYEEVKKAAKSGNMKDLDKYFKEDMIATDLVLSKEDYKVLGHEVNEGREKLYEALEKTLKEFKEDDFPMVSYQYPFVEFQGIAHSAEKPDEPILYTRLMQLSPTIDGAIKVAREFLIASRKSGEKDEEKKDDDSLVVRL